MMEESTTSTMFFCVFCKPPAISYQNGMAKTECPLWRWGDPFVFNVLQCRKCWFDTGRITWCSLKKNALNLKHGLTWFSQNYKQAQGGRITPWISKNHQNQELENKRKTSGQTPQLHNCASNLQFDLISGPQVMVSLMHRKAPSLDGTLMTWCRDLKEVP